MLDTKQHVGKLLSRIKDKFDRLLPMKYKDIGRFEFIDRNEKDSDHVLSYEVAFKPTDAYGNEDKVAWTSCILTIPKYEGFEDDWKKWCLYHSTYMRKTYLTMTALKVKHLSLVPILVQMKLKRPLVDTCLLLFR